MPIILKMQFRLGTKELFLVPCVTKCMGFTVTNRRIDFPNQTRPLLSRSHPIAPTPSQHAKSLGRTPPHALIPTRAHGGHGHSHGKDKASRAAQGEEDHNQALMVTWLGLGKNFVMTVGKAVIGVTSNSSALVADAAHSLSDMISDVVAVATLKVARLPADKNHPYGHGKFESIGALSVSAMLVTAGGGLAWHAFELMHHGGEVPMPGQAALWVSLGCVVVNEALFHITLRAGEKARSPTVIANAWHHRADAGASIVAFVGIGGSMMGFPFADPLAGGLVGLMIAKTGGEMVWQSVRDLTDTVEEDTVEALENVIKGVSGVGQLLSVRVRRMGPYSIVDAQIKVEKGISISAASQVAERARRAVMEEMPEVTEMLVHVTPDDSVWSNVGPTVEEGSESDGLHKLRSHHEIEADVRQALKRVLQVKHVSSVDVAYLGGGVQVRCGIELDPELRIRNAVDVARQARTEIELHVKDVTHVGVLLHLDDICWGQCGLTFGPSCATGFRLSGINNRAGGAWAGGVVDRIPLKEDPTSDGGSDPKQ